MAILVSELASRRLLFPLGFVHVTLWPCKPCFLWLYVEHYFWFLESYLWENLRPEMLFVPLAGAFIWFCSAPGDTTTMISTISNFSAWDFLGPPRRVQVPGWVYFHFTLTPSVQSKPMDGCFGPLVPFPAHLCKAWHLSFDSFYPHEPGTITACLSATFVGETYVLGEKGCQMLDSAHWVTAFPAFQWGSSSPFS